jgi:hypothetical protein
MATKCFQSIQGLCIRVTRLDSCCNPPSAGTPNSYVVSDSFITLGLTAELEEPDEFTLKLANGKLCINEIGVATLKRYTVELSLCNADPDLFEVMGGVTKVLDFNGDTVGYEIDQNLAGAAKFSLEFWTRVPVDQCLPGVDTSYVYWLLPCLQNGRVGDITIENGPLEFSFTADAIVSSAWGVGPYNVVPLTDGDDVGGALIAPITCNTALHVQLTTIAPPCESSDTCVTGAFADPDCGAKVMPPAPNTL